MILLIGGAFSGRSSFAFKLVSSISGSTEDERMAFVHKVDDSDAVEFLNETTEKKIIPELSRVVERISSFPVVVATEMGCGVVPVSESESRIREANGRLNIALSSVASTVVLMNSGIPTVIKGTLDTKRVPFSLSSFAVIFRHGQTLSNVNKQFAGGGSDVPLTALGERQAVETRERMPELFSKYQTLVRGKILNPRRVFVSPMVRARNTADILFPDAEKVVVEDIREMRMGLFENMTHEELSAGKFADGSVSEDNAAVYQRWLDSKGKLATPSSAGFKGESQDDFVKRTVAAFDEIRASLDDDEIPVIVAHGGVQMSLCEMRFSKSGFLKNLHDWQSENAMFRFGELK